MDKDYEQQWSSEVKWWGQTKERFASCDISSVRTCRDWPVLCPLELPRRTSHLLPEELANNRSKWRGEEMIQSPKKWMQGKPRRYFDRHFFPVCPQIATDSGIEGRWYCPPRRAFGSGGCGGGLYTFGFYTDWACYWHLISRGLVQQTTYKVWDISVHQRIAQLQMPTAPPLRNTNPQCFALIHSCTSNLTS